MTFKEFISYSATELKNIYSDNELKIIAPELIRKFCGVSKLELMLRKNDKIHEMHVECLVDSVSKLKENMPLEYVTGEADFLDMKLWTNPAVLIPRPETEDLVQYVKNFYASNAKPLNIIDLGTGSGCIALALKKIFPEAYVCATDVSNSALQVARYNANLNNLSVDFFLHDMLTDEHLPVAQNPDLIVSNPPYVLCAESATMHSRVKDYEPHLALYAESLHPLRYYHCLKDFVFRYLQPGGMFIFELNSMLTEDVMGIFQDHDDLVTSLNILKDSFLQNRFITGRKRT